MTDDTLLMWSASGPKPCLICLGRHGTIRTKADWEGLFPAHPGCMCQLIEVENTAMTNTSQQFHLTATSLTPNANRRYACTLIAAGPLQGHNLHMPANVLERDAAKFAGRPAHVNHHWAPQLETLVGLYENVSYDPDKQAITAELVLKSTPAADWLQRLVDELIADQDAGNQTFNIGLSADVWLDLSPCDDNCQRTVLAIRQVDSVDIVINPASDGARFERILAQAGIPAQSQTQEAPMTAPTAQGPAENTPTPAPQPTQAQAPAPDLVAELAALREQLSQLAARQAINGFDTPRPQPITQMRTPADEAQDIVNWMFGLHSAPLPDPAMRTPRAFYHALTGDWDWRGHVDASRAQFASASTINLADLAANAMNKVMVESWPALQPYRWFEDIVTVAPNDGSVQDMAWIGFGGIANLPAVAQGATYTELSVADSKESDSFIKYGGYVGVTEEMWRNNDLQRMQTIPRALAVAAVRTRSAAIAAIFTANSGVGPTLDDDGTALFHANHGANVQTTALSKAAWTAARLECFKMGELGSGKRLGLYPKYALIPADLWETALEIFGYGAGPGGYATGAATTIDNVNVYGVGRSPSDPRPVPIVVPDWTDTNDWAYLVDPALHPVLMMSYAQNPGGRTHPMPELFSVTAPTAGMVFTNDVLPIKVRDWFSYGVATWRGIGKRNVS